MTSNEFEERKRQLEEHHRAGIELLEAAHRRQIRALEIVYLTAAADEVQIPSLAAPAEEVPSILTTAVTPPAFSRRGAGELRAEVQAVLSRLPQVFDRHDVCRALGQEPDRSSLFRALRELVQEGVLAVEEVGRGKVAGTYRRS